MAKERDLVKLARALARLGAAETYLARARRLFAESGSEWSDHRLGLAAADVRLVRDTMASALECARNRAAAGEWVGYGEGDRPAEVE
jgi:hypothetical protein